jgi:hypothetical protein
MTAARDLLLDEWDVPFPNDTEAQGNVLALRPVAEKALLDRVVSSVQNQVRDMSTDSTPFSDLPYNIQFDTSRFTRVDSLRLLP